MERTLQSFAFLAEKPLRIDKDLETGRVILTFSSTFRLPGIVQDAPMSVILSTEAARALLSDLPRLHALLSEASGCITDKQESVQ